MLAVSDKSKYCTAHLRTLYLKCVCVYVSIYNNFKYDFKIKFYAIPSEILKHPFKSLEYWNALEIGTLAQSRLCCSLRLSFHRLRSWGRERHLLKSLISAAILMHVLKQIILVSKLFTHTNEAKDTDCHLDVPNLPNAKNGWSKRFTFPSVSTLLLSFPFQ